MKEGADLVESVSHLYSELTELLESSALTTNVSSLQDLLFR